MARASNPDLGPIDWVVLAPGERPESVLDRRGGVDLLLGGPTLAHVRLAEAGRLDLPDLPGPSSWRAVRRPIVDRPEGLRDPRLDPASLALAKSVLRARGWPKGYEALVRRASGDPPSPVESGEPPGPILRSEGLAIVRGAPNRSRAIRFVGALESRGISGPPPADAIRDAEADGLLADLLGSALVDALDELRQARSALGRFGHPAEAEAAIGRRPPWPPASILKLRAEPGGDAMVETLLEQIAPGPESRAFLLESWSKPGRPIDGALLDELAGADGGRVALEPRFRAWLRGEWTAWTRQLYRRVARVAGGYVPS